LFAEAGQLSESRFVGRGIVQLKMSAGGERRGLGQRHSNGDGLPPRTRSHPQCAASLCVQNDFTMLKRGTGTSPRRKT
jgi:hypothetical protein